MFKDIPETDGCYSCDEYGNIKSNSRICWNGFGFYELKERILRPYINNKGYVMVDLRVGGKTLRKLVHRLVAITWIENPNGYEIVNHKDCNTLNNHIGNLEWCTYSYNNKYAFLYGNRTYTEKQKQTREMPKKYLWVPVEQYDLDGNYLRSFCSLTEAGHAVSDNPRAYSNISTCCKGKAKTAYGYIWKYKNQQQQKCND